jgi:hypothetical protein
MRICRTLHTRNTSGCMQSVVRALQLNLFWALLISLEVLFTGTKWPQCEADLLPPCMCEVWNMWIVPSMSPVPLYCILLLRPQKGVPYICHQLLCSPLNVLLCVPFQLCNQYICMNISSDSHCLWQALWVGWHRPEGVGGKYDRMQRVGSLKLCDHCHPWNFFPWPQYEEFM